MSDPKEDQQKQEESEDHLQDPMTHQEIQQHNQEPQMTITTKQAQNLLESDAPQQQEDSLNGPDKMAESIIVKIDKTHEDNRSQIQSNNQEQSDNKDSQAVQQSMVFQRAKFNLQQTMIAPEQEVQPEEDTNLIPENHFYPEDHQEHESQELPISKAVLSFYDCFGNDSFKRYNLWLIDDETWVTASGISYQFYNYITGENSIFFSRDGGGIGSVSVHPDKKFYAIAEKGVWPNIYIYNYPEHRLYRILRKGTERSYSNSTFSFDGDTFATVGSDPDYQICIWNWRQEKIMLKAKAFSQEVYRVQFSQYNPNILGTSGMGHIKFWKVAETFTGLKLKGEIAKFGQVELSDIYSFFAFPDGKFLSGTEYGRLILWEGNVIKCVVGISSEQACHNGSVDVVTLDGEYVVSGGADGYIRLWRFHEIDQAEGDDQLNYFMNCAKEVLLQDGEDLAHINQIQKAENFWIVGDAKGRVWKIELPDFERKAVVYRTNSGKLYDLAAAPTFNASITVGQDGVVRLWDYVSKRQYYERKFPASATCCEWLPFTRKNSGRVVVVGFTNGIVRFLLLKTDGFFLLKALKVHPQAIQLMRVSKDGGFLAVVSVNGDIFLLQISPQNIQNIEPFCLYETKLQITDVYFDNRGEKLLVGCKDGTIHEIRIPRTEEIDNSETYLTEFKARIYTIKMMESQKPKKEEMDLEFLLRRNKDEKIPEVEWDPAPVLNLCYFDNDCTRVICSVDGKYLGYLYVIDFNKERPIDALIVPKLQTQFLSFQENNDLLVIGFKNGSFQLRHRSDFRQYTQKETHDMDYGKVRKVLLNYDKTAILSTSEDGTFYVNKIDYQTFVSAARGMFIDKYDYPELSNGITSGTLNEDIQLENPVEEEIVNDKIYSIQQAKLLAEEDHRRNEADKKKEKKLQVIKNLRMKFEQIRKENEQADEFSKLTQEELCVDPDYIEMLHRRVEEDVEETRKELEWDQYYAKLKTDKLKRYVKDELEVDKFCVKAIRDPKCFVFTFKVKKLTDYVKSKLTEIYQLIEEEKKLQAQKEQEMQNTNVVQENKTQQVITQQQTTQQQMAGPSIMGQDNREQQQNGENKKTSAKAEREKQKQEEEKIRKEQEELEKTKPTKEAFEPDHNRDIQEAQETLGDYKLKSSKDYIVPDNQRMNVSKKRKHMFMLEDFIYNTKIRFNQQLINLKSRKVALIDKIKKYNEIITKINQQLNITEELFTPTLDITLEDPDSFMNINDDQIEEYAKQKLKDSLKKASAYSMGGGGTQATEVQQTQQEKKPQAQGAVASKPQEQLKTRKGIKVQQSSLEEEMKIVNEMRLIAEKQRMREEIEDEINQFDKDLQICQSEKSVLESDMTVAKMKLVTFYQELIILDDMEEDDNKLLTELLNFKNEKNNLDKTSENIMNTLQKLAKEEQQNEKELNEQMKAFKEQVYQEDDVKREKIHQYYLKRYKKEQAKKIKVSNQDDENEDEDEDNASEEEEDEDDYMDDDDDEKPDISLVENDVKLKEIIDKICQLEDAQETKRKEKMEQERQKVQIANKIKQILVELKRAEEDLRAYQRKKLQRVNQLDVSYLLRLTQIQNLIEKNNQQGDKYILPTDLNSSILFTDSEFMRLCIRIKELGEEQKKIEEQRRKKEKTKKVVSEYLDIFNQVFEKEIAIKNAKIDELNKKYEEKHMLKFGDIIDLKILDALEPTKQVLEMRGVFKQEEKQAVKKVEEAKRGLQEVKKKLLDSKKENTKIINNITKLGKQQMDLSKKLDSTNKQLFKEENEERRSDLEREQQNLKDLVKFLSKEIEDLKTEIGLFKRKGGHIYTMVTSTKKQFG